MVKILSAAEMRRVVKDTTQEASVIIICLVL